MQSANEKIQKDGSLQTFTELITPLVQIVSEEVAPDLKIDVA